MNKVFGWLLCFGLVNPIPVFAQKAEPRLPTWTQRRQIHPIWDGNWSDAKSGVEREPLYDDGKTEWKAGPPPPQVFWRPDTPQADDVDPEEFRDQTTGKFRAMDYSPYALLQLPRALPYRGKLLPRGYYLVKAGGMQDGSPNNRAFTPLTVVPDPNQPQPAYTTASPTPLKAVHPRKIKWLPPVPGNTRPAPHAPYRVFVLKQRGTVIGVLPITQQAAYRFHKGEKPPRQPVTWVQTGINPQNNQNTLYFYEQGRLYSTIF